MKRKPVFIAIGAIFFLAILFLLTGIWLWNSDRWVPWVEKYAAKRILEAVSEQNEVELVDFEISISGDGFRGGKIDRVFARFRKENIEWTHEGRVFLEWDEAQKDSKLTAQFDQEWFFDRKKVTRFSGIASLHFESTVYPQTVVRAIAYSVVGKDLFESGLSVRPIKWSLDLGEFSWPQEFLGLSFSELKLSSVGSLESFQASVSFDEMEFEDEVAEEEWVALVENGRLEMMGDRNVGFNFQSKLNLGTSEVLKGEDYFAPDFSEFEFNFNAKLEDSFDPSEITFRLSRKKDLTISGALDPKTKLLKLNAKILDLSGFLSWIWNALDENVLEPWEFLSGSLRLESELDLNLEAVNSIGVDLKGLDVRNEDLDLFLSNIRFNLPKLRVGQAGRATLSIVEGFWKKVRYNLSRTEIDWSSGEDQRWVFEVSEFPLMSPDLPIKIGKVTGSLDSKFLNYRMSTSLSLASLKLSKVLDLVCSENENPVPLEFEMNYPVVYFSDSDISLTGKTTAKLFEGFLSVEGIEIENFNSSTPTTYFDLDWGGIRLDLLGDWSKFGRMDGTIEGHAKSVQLRSFFPTAYDLRVEAKPFDDDVVVFGPVAMKNFTRLFAGEDLDSHLPGIVDWLAFGWISRLFGGYDVYYAGFQAKAKDSRIVLETLDPPDVLRQERQHFILYGPRFKMPIRSIVYPVVLDGPSMAHLVNHIGGTISNLQTEDAEGGSANESSLEVKSSLANEDGEERTDENEARKRCTIDARQISKSP